MQDLDNTVWEEVYNCSNADIAYQNFLKQFLSKYEKNFLVKNISLKKHTICKKPWMTKKLLKMVNKKNIMYKLYCKHPSTITR